MLYLIKAAYLDDNGLPKSILKFGYSDNWIKRYTSYRSYQPGVRVLKLYDGGNLDDEARVKEYLKLFCIYGSEWFIDCEVVIEFFKFNDTLDKLRESTKYSLPLSSLDLNPPDYFLINFVIDSFYSMESKKFCLLRSRLFGEELRGHSFSEQRDIIFKRYSCNESDYRNWFMKNSPKSPSKELLSMVKEIREESNEVRRLALLREFKSNHSEEDYQSLLFYLPRELKTP